MSKRKGKSGSKREARAEQREVTSIEAKAKALVGTRSRAGAEIVGYRSLGTMVLFEIRCTEEGCSNTRLVAPQDLFQVKRCLAHQRAYAKAKAKAKAKARAEARRAEKKALKARVQAEAKRKRGRKAA